MSDHHLKQSILADLAPMFAEAERDGLWFNSTYQDLWFSPDELRKQHGRGSFVWGPVNWTLRDPKEHLARVRRAIEEHKREVAEIEARIGGSK